MPTPSSANNSPVSSSTTRSAEDADALPAPGGGGAGAAGAMGSSVGILLPSGAIVPNDFYSMPFMEVDEVREEALTL